MNEDWELGLVPGQVVIEVLLPSDSPAVRAFLLDEVSPVETHPTDGSSPSERSTAMTAVEEEVTTTGPFAVGQLIDDHRVFNALPVGSLITARAGRTYTKVADDSWRRDDTGTPMVSDMFALGYNTITRIGPEEVEAPVAEAPVETPRLVVGERLTAETRDAAPVGTTVVHQTNSGAVRVKQESGSWRRISDDNVMARLRTPYDYIIVSVPLQVGDPVQTSAQFRELPIGTEVEDEECRFRFRKIEGERWQNLANSVVLHGSGDIRTGGFFRVVAPGGTAPDINSRVGQTVTRAMLNDLPVGSVIQYREGPVRWTKVDPATMRRTAASRPGNLGAEVGVAGFSIGTGYTVVSVPDAPHTETPPTPDLPAVGTLIARPSDVLPTLPVGTVISYSTARYVKQETGRWAHVGSGSTYQSQDFGTDTYRIHSYPDAATTEAATEAPVYEFDQQAHIRDLMERARRCIDRLASEENWDMVPPGAYRRLNFIDQENEEPSRFVAGNHITARTTKVLPVGSYWIEQCGSHGNAYWSMTPTGPVCTHYTGTDQTLRERVLQAPNGATCDWDGTILHVADEPASMRRYETGREFVEALWEEAQRLKNLLGWCGAADSALERAGLTPDTYTLPAPPQPPLVVGSTVTHDDQRFRNLPAGTVIRAADGTEAVKLSATWYRLDNTNTYHPSGSYVITYMTGANSTGAE